MSNDDRDLTTTDEQQEDPKPVARKKTGRASGKAIPSRGKSSGGGVKTESNKTPEGQRETRNGKPIRKTASGFVVVG